MRRCDVHHQFRVEKKCIVCLDTLEHKSLDQSVSGGIV